MALRSCDQRLRQLIGIVFRSAGNRTFCRFDEWKAVFRRTTIAAKPPLFRLF
jgi:hypothetical protein